MSVILLTGGARSGKSTAAVKLGERWGGPVTLIATAEPSDEEMRSRIEAHRASRPPTWSVVEEPLELPKALQGVPEDSMVIVDCLTTWVNNRMWRNDDSDATILAVSEKATEVAAAHQAPVVVVTNEVGSGIVPANELARRYRDLLGAVNAVWAGVAGAAYLAVAGRIVELADLRTIDLG
jgi:adenosyl cobinamide kinase/adenosyl cobinamide phosphate guanylyltransferase